VSSICLNITTHCAVSSIRFSITKPNLSYTFYTYLMCSFVLYICYRPGALYPRFSEIWFWNTTVRFEVESSWFPANSSSGLDISFCSLCNGNYLL
jgi:hypothetical protein